MRSSLRFAMTVVVAFLVLTLSCSERKSETDKEDDIATCPPKDADNDIPMPEPENKLAAVHIIEISQMKFQPADLHIHKGDQVVWVNKDIVDHDVTQQPKKIWSSSVMKPGTSWAKVFYVNQEYFCNLHQVMKGRIIVD